MKIENTTLIIYGKLKLPWYICATYYVHDCNINIKISYQITYITDKFIARLLNGTSLLKSDTNIV